MRVLFLLSETWILRLLLSCIDHWDPCTTSWEVTQQAARIIHVMKKSCHCVQSISLVFMTAVPHNIEMPLFLSSTESKPYASFRTPAKWLYWSCQNWADHCERAHQTDRRSTVNKLTWIGKRISFLEELFILAGMCVLWLTEKTRDSLSKLSGLTHLKCNRYSPQDLTLQGTCFATDSLRLRFFRVRSQKERIISHNAIVSINGGV